MTKSLVVPATFTAVGLVMALTTDNWVWLGAFAAIGIACGLIFQTRRK